MRVNGQFRPILDRILVRRMPEETVSAGGVILPDQARKPAVLGEVLAAGPGRVDRRTGERVPLDVAVGDQVSFEEWVGAPITLNGEDLLVMKDTDLLGLAEGA